ncbi:hypothetical protein LCL99_11915 [Halomonas denitrificans]|uniref:hypothetical protein n=1 Tax=Halomonas TaxID=2745 RepID=UPI001A902D96|nr:MULTISPECIES: hypothetical protein [Halomonas]MED5294910.1 hypothetical protein [Pseudomonadota bacterium]MBN8412086.1 hypothetical protein [Halomonas litopenaei]MBY5929936.1 hypothetical protein [Halomonas sp. DP8Y7-3]MBY6207875.1 hypothetical protein [Halomonas sp. DP3Y7-2]MBY6228684.1 hypothetical protein [Halomonas sp. DP3Y7-1]
MSRSSSAAKPLLWLAILLFAAFFINVAIQRYLPGLWTMGAAEEGILLAAATATFVSACLKFEAGMKAEAEATSTAQQQGQ